MPQTTITSFSATPLDLPLTEPFAIAKGAPVVAHNVLVRVVLTSGVVGLGEAAPFTAVSGETQGETLAIISELGRSLIGRDAGDWRALGAELLARASTAPAARCGLEMAVVDAFARQREMPLWQLFGGQGTELDTDMTVTAGDEAHAVASARAITARGIHTIKVKIGKSASEDVARMRAISATAPAARLYADANAGYSLADARAFLHGLRTAKVPLALLEQPLAREDELGWQILANESEVPLCADESARSAKDVERIAALGLARTVNIKVMKSGVAEAVAMMESARAHGLGLMVGGMVESILAMSFSAHLAAGFGGVDFVDLDTPMFIASHPFEGGFMQDGGHLSVKHLQAGHGVLLAP